MDEVYLEDGAVVLFRPRLAEPRAPGALDKYGHHVRRTKFWLAEVGACICRDCERLPDFGSVNTLSERQSSAEGER